MNLVYRPPFLDADGFEEWKKKACAAREKLPETGSPAGFEDRVWKNFKNEFLTELGRCAYCEGRYLAGEFGDAEHYRPKGKVTEGQSATSHPGYYWLAYEWHNLLLACKKCNSSHPDLDRPLKPGKHASHPGKLCEFPVRAARVTCPSADPEKWMEELLAEEPMLLHPYLDDPRDHFEARKEGWLWHKTERGRATIDVCHLNRKELRDERKRAEESVKSRVTCIWLAQLRPDDDSRSQWYGPTDQFSTYLNCKVEEELDRFTQRLLAARAGGPR